jgi:hypothetical protein
MQSKAPKIVGELLRTTSNGSSTRSKSQPREPQTKISDDAKLET